MSKDLTRVSLQEIEGWFLSLGFVFFQLPNSSYLKLLDPGGIVDEAFLTKLKRKKCEEVPVISVVDQKHKESLINLFKKLKNSQLEVENIECSREILNDFKKVFVEGSHDYSLLDYLLAFQEVFSLFLPEFFKQVAEMDVDIFKRNMVMATFSVFLCLQLGYLDFNFLSDVYHACFLMDISLYEDVLPWSTHKAIENEQRLPGEGLRTLTDFKNIAGRDAFVQHPLKSMQIAYSEYGNVFYNRGVLNVITKHQENAAGTGFPQKLIQSDFADWEAVIVFVEHLIPHEPLLLDRGSGRGILKNLITNLYKNSMGQFYHFDRIAKILKKEFQIKLEVEKAS